VLCTCQEEKNPYVKAEHLLDHMFRRSDEDFARFRVALRNCRQEHVIKRYLEQLSESVVESECLGEDMTAVVQPTDSQCQPEIEPLTTIDDEMEVVQPSEGASLQEQEQCQ